MNDFCKLVFSFTFYSFLGWACETIYCSVPAKKFINRGFLSGPFCPVYGFGALLVIKVLSPAADYPLVVFLLGMLLTSALEYLTSYILEKSFHTKWWDYSIRKFNIHGRVCLKNSLMFGVLSVVLLLFIDPAVRQMMNQIPQWLELLFAVFLLCYFIADSCLTIRTMLQINGKLAQMAEVMAEISERNAAIKAKMYKSLEDKLESLDSVLDDETKERLERLLQRWNEMGHITKHLQRRLIKAFPNMISIKHNESLLWIKENVLNRNKKNK